MPNFFEQVSIPRLPERPANQENFCTYPIFDANSLTTRIVWQIRPHLIRNFELYEKNHPQFKQLCRLPDTEQEIALFWRKVATERSEPQSWEPAQKRQWALEHLAAYFETDCYYAAKKIYAKSREYSWDEYFCIARSFIYDLNKLLEVLQRYASSQGSLENYIQEVLLKTIQSEAGVSRFSRWRLLCKKGDSELKGALERGGCESGEIACFLFARKYFKQVYMLSKVKNLNRQKGQKWPEPDSEDFSSAAQCYNAEKVLPIAPHEVAAGENVSGKQIEIWMKRCIEVLQNYRNSIIPKSLDQLQETGIFVKSEEKTEVFDIADKASEEWQETRESQSKISKETYQVFWQQLETLKPEQHKLLLLYYGIDLRQKEIAKIFNRNQGSISHRLDTIRKKFLQTLTASSGQNKWVDEYVAGWLYKNYRSPQKSDYIQAALVEAVKNLDCKSQQVLHLHYGQKIPLEKIADLWGMKLAEVEEKRQKAKHNLQDKVITKLQEWMKEYVDKWLSRVYKALLLQACRQLKFPHKTEIISQKIEAIVEETLKITRESK